MTLIVKKFLMIFLSPVIHAKSLKRAPDRPVVSLPLATEFNQCVVIDLKEWVCKKVWLLYLIDAATRFTLASVIRSNVSLLRRSRCYRWVMG